MHQPFIDYMAKWFLLQNLWANDKGESEEADNLRDEMSDIYRQLSQEEKRVVCGPIEDAARELKKE